MKPTVSVVIPFYNCPYVGQAVQSALNQTYRPLEVIVVDDGSTSHVERLAPYRSRIHYLGKANGGTASALNHGIRHASGKYIAWLSSDDIFYPKKISRQVAFMQQQNAAISHTNFHCIDSAGNVTRSNAVPAGMLRSSADFYRCFLHANPVNGCTVMIRRDLFAAIGLFDESLPYTHDLDFWYRVILAGTHFPFLNESLTGYRWHEGMGTLQHHERIQPEIAHTQSRHRGALVQILSRMNI
ncbi:glycosyltransferase [Paenibacillus macerans]|uniref:glycosyltransferase n=1 Tax=Paenibacillus macerans TaxID=44252 RepID=UPI00203B0435|nr:glycosyltransferase [Paenibacillus macerans]MCM3700456.1 glycosyltransferase [Paenibacillus macerans]